MPLIEGLKKQPRLPNRCKMLTCLIFKKSSATCGTQTMFCSSSLIAAICILATQFTRKLLGANTSTILNEKLIFPAIDTDEATGNEPLALIGETGAAQSSWKTRKSDNPLMNHRRKTLWQPSMPHRTKRRKFMTNSNSRYEKPGRHTKTKNT